MLSLLLVFSIKELPIGLLQRNLLLQVATSELLIFVNMNEMQSFYVQVVSRRRSAKCYPNLFQIQTEKKHFHEYVCDENACSFFKPDDMNASSATFELRITYSYTVS